MFDSGVIVRESTASLSIRLLWPFIAIARDHNRTALIDRFQLRLGLKGLKLEHPDTRVPLRIAGALLTELIEETGLPGVALLAAQQITAEHIGLTEYLARSKNTLGAALVGSVRVAKLLCDGVSHSFEVKDNFAFVRCWFDTNIAWHDAAYELALAVQLNCMRRITGISQLVPLEAHFMHATPQETTLHEAFFDCKLRFNMPFTQLVLPTSVLSLPLPGSEPDLSRLLEHQAHLSLTHLPNAQKLAARVLTLLAAELGFGTATSKRVAQRLGISSRTLARRLMKENTSYHRLFDQARRDLALRDLANTAHSIREIAKQLGFASSQSFHRAFRRWTGSTVSSYRSSARQCISTELHVVTGKRSAEPDDRLRHKSSPARSRRSKLPAARRSDP